MSYALALGLLFPLLGFLGLVSTSAWIPRRLTGIAACTTVACSFLCFSLFLTDYTQTHELVLFNWLDLPGIHTDFLLHMDGLSLLMSLIITGVGFLIHVYSIGYIEHDHDYARYFACLNLFIFAMLILVLAGDLLVLFVGWEGVGLASYLLIGYWYDRPQAAKAATKAFVVNRIGDFGLLTGILLTISVFGTANINEISRLAPQVLIMGAPVAIALALLYFMGAVGKSAQLPLHVWLPDAMEGPTPVSALIHAATMVTAGVYLLIRMHAILLLAPEAMQIIAIVGATTALFASICAVAQTDLKRVLAYSTVSQLGLMFLACGLGAFYAAMFHLTAHAFVKALLFLSAGNIVHKMHGVTEMHKMGGLAQVFTKTHKLFLLGVLGLSGVPPLVAFFSKEAILDAAHVNNTLFIVALIASLLTAVYMTRAYCLTFLGKLNPDNQRLKEAPSVMVIPISILAFLSLVGGGLGYAFAGKAPLEKLLQHVFPVQGEEAASIFTFSTWCIVAAIVLVLVVTFLVYTNMANRLTKPLLILRKAFFIDQIYDVLFVFPVRGIARLITYILEPYFFEGMIDMTGHLTQKCSMQLQRIQSGQIRSYVAWMTLGVVFLVAYVMVGL